jgi:hypothetical protein
MRCIDPKTIADQKVKSFHKKVLSPDMPEWGSAGAVLTLPKDFPDKLMKSVPYVVGTGKYSIFFDQFMEIMKFLSFT